MQRMNWTTLASLALGLLVPAFNEGGDKEKRPEDQYIKVEIRGSLQHSVAAIGGETTGTEITAGGITWELEFGRQKNLHKLAEKLDGKTVLVKGTLEVRKGVEIPKRWIVTVASLREAKKSEKTRRKSAG